MFILVVCLSSCCSHLSLLLVLLLSLSPSILAVHFGYLSSVASAFVVSLIVVLYLF